jgi:surface protein
MYCARCHTRRTALALHYLGRHLDEKPAAAHNRAADGCRVHGTRLRSARMRGRAHACTCVHARACRHTDATLRAAVALWFDDKAAAVTQYGPIGDWDTRDVTSMRDLFRGRATFNEDISRWNAGNVEDMYGMFYSAASFNRPLAKWDVRSVKTMRCMFLNASSFNQPLDTWDVSSVEDMGWMFALASFDQPPKLWAVASGMSQSNMCDGAASFKQPAKFARSVEDMGGMFLGATKFNAVRQVGRAQRQVHERHVPERCFVQPAA